MINLELTERQGVALDKVLAIVYATALDAVLAEDEKLAMAALYAQLRMHYEGGDPDG